MGMISTVTIAIVEYSVYALTADAVSDADDYLGGKIGTADWVAASDDTKKQALVSSARWIDRTTEWTGTETAAGQDRDWPRDNATCNGIAVVDGSTPDELAWAEFELAFVLVEDATAQQAHSQGSNVKSAKGGSAKVEFFSQTTGTSADSRLPSVAHDLVKCYFASRIQAARATGIDDDTAFDPDDFDRSRGFA